MSIMGRARKAVGLGAVIGLLHAQAAHAQQCITPEDLTDAGIYSVPVLAEGFETSCAPHLAEHGFFATRGDEFVAPYAAMQEERWPGTRRAFLLLGASGGDDEADVEGMELLASLDPDALRPLVDAFLAQKIGEEIKPEDCPRIEQVMELLAPLPPENFGGLLTFILEVSGVNEPQVCETGRP